MKVKSSFKYFMGDLRLAMIIFYSIQIGVTLLIAILGALMLNWDVTDSFSANNSVDAASIIFLLIMGLVAYKDGLLIHGQNGISRRTFFLGRLSSAAAAAVIMTTVDLAFTQLMTVLFRSVHVGVNTVIGLMNQPFLYRMAFTLLVYFLFILLGNTTAALFYRLGKMGKVLVGAGVPVLLFLIFPLMEIFVTNGSVALTLLRFVLWAFGISTGKAYMALVSTAVLSLLTCGLGWLLVRRAPAVSK